MAEVNIQKNIYMPGLDGLRALAVFAVIAYHLGLPFVPGGFLGVTMFFVLSGYLITDLLITEWILKEKISLKSFFVRRAKRLLPSVFFLLICLSAYISVFRPELLATLKSELLPAAFSFSNWWFIFNDIPYFSAYSSPSLLNHFWSLAVEVQFYIVWPFLLLALQRLVRSKWLKITLTAIAAIASAALMAYLFVPGADPSRIYYGTDTRVFSLLIGACLAFVYPSLKVVNALQKKSMRVILDIAGFIALLSTLFMIYFITQYDDFLYRGGMALFSVASMLLIAAAASPLTIIGKIFSFKPLRFIGKISYGVYLWQFPVIIITNTLFASNTTNIALNVFQVAFTILMATISYFLIENPIRKNNLIGFARKKSFRDFCQSCLRTRWWEKTAVLLVIALLLTSGIGFLNAQAIPSSGFDEELSALPSQMVISPSEKPGAPSPSPVASPSPDTTPSASPGSSPANGTASPGVTPGSTPDSLGSAAPEIIPSDLDLTIIGDSIAIDIAPYLEDYYPNMYLDAVVGRQFYQAKTIVKQMLQKNTLGSTVVIELGSNGAFSESQMRGLIEEIGFGRKVVFVNTQVPRTWCTSVNDTLEKISSDYANTTVANWYNKSLDKSDYFYNDGFHPNKTGSPILAKIIAEAIVDVQDPVIPNAGIL